MKSLIEFINEDQKWYTQTLKEHTIKGSIIATCQNNVFDVQNIIKQVDDKCNQEFLNHDLGWNKFSTVKYRWGREKKIIDNKTGFNLFCEIADTSNDTLILKLSDTETDNTIQPKTFQEFVDIISDYKKLKIDINYFTNARWANEIRFAIGSAHEPGEIQFVRTS